MELQRSSMALSKKVDASMQPGLNFVAGGRMRKGPVSRKMLETIQLRLIKS